MKINLSPQCRDDTLSVVVSGDVLILNGEAFDFTPLPEGATLPKEAVTSQWIISEITRKYGQIELTLLLPHVHGASEAARFPMPLIVTNDGLVELPV